MAMSVHVMQGFRYEAKLDAYNFLIGKFTNYRAGKGFHDMPDGLFGERHY